MKGRKSNINDAGISLLELIIAVSIFAIAAVIFLQAFVTTGRVNKKSAIYLNATTTAQNLMEELKAKSFEEVSLAFNYPIDSLTKQMRLGMLSEQKDQLENGELILKESLKEGRCL